MRAALFQGPARPGSVSDNLAVMARMASSAAGQEAGLLVLPELFLTGYNIGADALQAAGEAEDGPSARAAANIARDCGLALLYGYPERASDGQLYNSARLVGPDGARLANYRKTHLFGDMERTVFTPGRVPFVLAELGGLRLGVLVCYDVEFPEMVRGLALRGADLVAVPTALMRPYDFVPQVMVRSRAFENQVFLIYANRCGEEGALTYVGESCIVSPGGDVLARAAAGEALLVAELDTGAMADSRALNTYLRDRLPAHYDSAETPL